MVKLIDAAFDTETGVSTATIRTDLGTFHGSSKLWEEDINVKSNYAGCEYAETRAIIKYLKEKLKRKRIELDTLKSFESELISYKSNYNENSYENKKLRKRIHLKKKEINELKENINSLQSKLVYKMQNRSKLITEMINKYKKEEAKD